MFTSDREGTTKAGSSSREESPEITETSQQTDVDRDEQFDKLRYKDEVYLLNKEKFFPELAWNIVMKKFDKKTNIENCSNASPFFGQYLQEKREMEVVLPKIFEILTQRYCDKYNKDESYKETNFKSIPWSRKSARRKEPHRMTGLLKCRLVCKKWNKAIEGVHRNEDDDNHTLDYDDSDASEWGTDRFSGEQKVAKFLGLFEATHSSAVQQSKMFKKCPFLGRFVEVEYDPNCVEDRKGYFNRLIEMFEKFGDHVWYLKLFLRCTWSVHEHVYLYLKVKQFVELMPNLKELRFRFFCFTYSSRQQLVLQCLEEEIQRHPFPKSIKLELISVEGIPGVLCNHLVNQNRQISRLEIKSVDFNGNCTIFDNMLPNVNEIDLMWINPIDILETLERYQFTLNLEKLKFWCSDSFHCDQFVPWSRIFNAIGSKFNSDTCTVLNLKMPRPRSDLERMSVLKDSLECRLKLANIQLFHISSLSNFSLDFLLPTRDTLKEIDIWLRYYIAKENGEQEELRDKQVIKFVGIEDKMEESNIGKELSRLNKLSLNGRTSRGYIIQPNGVVKVVRTTIFCLGAR